MAASSDFHKGRHVVHKLNVHLVFVTKYRRGCISERAFGVLDKAWRVVATDFDATIVEAGFEPDHVHLLVSYPPKISISSLVNSLKGVSARMLRQARFPEIEQALWGAHFWSPSYCAVSCGGAPLEVVKQYVERQRGRSSPS